MEKPENYINLNEIQIMRLCNELAEITYELKQNKHVECIYFAPYKNLGSIRGYVVNITAVFDSEDNFEELDKQYQKRISRKNQLSKFGVKIYINTTSKNGYTHLPVKPSEREKGNDIFNSTILFDRTGEYTKIKEITENIESTEHSNLCYYGNLAEINPSIDDRLEYAMDTQEIKIMNKAFKKSANN